MRFWIAGWWMVVALALASCSPDNCLSADGDCTVPTPCAELELACAGGVEPTVRVLASGDPIPGGIDALASPGDVVLDNGVVTAVIDALDHPHYVAPTGGNLIDLTSAARNDDSLTHLFHGVGLLPDDTIVYDRLTTESGPGFAAVQVFGSLAGFERVRVATRYELRGCEPGIRVRTEIANLTTEPRSWSLVDAWYWSGREALPFAPGVGRGFEQPGLVDTVEDSWEDMPFMAAAAHVDPGATYFEVACDRPALSGWHTEQLSAVGLPPRIVQPRDFEIFERFIGVTGGRGLAPAVDQALGIRDALFDEPTVELRGRVTGELVFGDEARATVLVEEGTLATPPEERTPWTQVTPRVDGSFDVRVPASRSYVVTVRSFGRDEAQVEARAMLDDVDVGTLALAPAPGLDVSVTVDGVADWAMVFVHPADDATDADVRAHFFGGFYECAPLLGSSTGGSPACDRILVNGSDSVALPPGRYDVFATAGLFATVARDTITVASGERAAVSLALERLPVAPAGTLGADFHVHGGASFDSTVPDFDRVAAWLAANIDVLAATDHDVVWDYANARAALGADDRLRVLVGLEATGHILFDLTPGHDIPQVIGHWNVWPLPFEVDGAYRGAPWDELVEPGALFDRFVDAGWPRDTGVIQLNHPWSPAQFGRDLGFPRAVGVDARVPLPREYDGTGPSLVLRTPDGAGFGNADYHTQEVMNGTANEDLQPFRAYWFYLLNQGIVRAGTGNSDSHGLVDNLLGTPRTLVWTDQVLGSFDDAAFNADVRAGHMIGTNGPVIEIATTDASGGARTPSVEAFAPGPGALLSIRVSAAPWVPVDEVRIVVNGRVARTLQAELSHPVDPFGVDGLVRFEGDVALSELLPDGTADAWIVVEAGEALPLTGDLNCDGIPDTGDIDGDGVVDWRDVERDDPIDAAPELCDPDQEIGPLGHPPEPARDAPGYVFLAVTPEGYPFAFTNPLLFDRDGGGFSGPGLEGP
ncbi:MAG: CehA/McbA family metallohydrolase [Sandaracinaceae bacterium]|nr:CehA/McbA family metallohydrolase [Sandaracinaceae bacterium]